jgi:hypothetical protein|tara:strand:- start:5248 stop:5442 length:195 start_codon:yes stop_codon:yes gene_type:complete
MSEQIFVHNEICTRPNKEQLAQDVVDGWDLNDLVDFAIWKLVDDYEMMSNEAFVEQWINFHGDE